MTIDLTQIDRKVLMGASRRDLIKLAKDLDKLKHQAAKIGPQNDDELHALIKEKWGIYVPRIAVDTDRGHCAPFDMIADVYFERINAGLAVAGRESGKCVAQGSLITDAQTGRRIPIENVVAGERALVGTLGQDSVLTYRFPTQTHDTGTSRCLKITLASGRSVVTTPEHPYLTETRWKRADELAIGTCVATPASAPLPLDPVEIDDELVDLLALIATEGCTTGGRAVFSSADDYIIEIAGKIADRYGCSVVKLTGQYDWAFKKQSGGRTNTIIDLLREHELFGRLAKHKRIPPIVFLLGRKQLSRFLSVFWMCDGYVCKGDVGITLASQGMVEDIQHLLLRFGIQSHVKHRIASNSSGDFDAWRLTVYGNHVSKLNDELGLWGEKRQRLVDVASVKSVSRSGRPPLTNEIMQTIVSNMPVTTRGDGAPQRTFKHLGWRISKPTASVGKVLTQGGVKTLQARRLRALCYGRNVDELVFDRLLSEDIWWDYIVSIEDAGEHRVFDLTMEGTENYVVNDIIAHNTFDVAIIHALNARFKPGYEGISSGAVSEQSKRAYSALKKLNRTWGGIDAKTTEKSVKEANDVESSLQSETVYRNGSTVSILGGTVAQLNGPHSNLLHRDEVELFRRDAFEEANNITRTGYTNDGKPIKAVDILTSSLKYAKGLLQEILERVEEAIQAGTEPPYKVYRWGVAETISPVPNCRNDPKNASLPESELCPCARVVNGMWDDGSPRSLQQVCAGGPNGTDYRFARGDGYRPLEPDIVNKFLQNTRIVWEAQQECIKPAAEGLILENFAKERHGVRGYMPDPENGLIFNSTDFGGCYDGDTEVLTDRGWVPWSEVTLNDKFASMDPVTEQVEYQTANWIVDKEYHGKMNRWLNNSVDLLVTEDHNMVVEASSHSVDKWELVSSNKVRSHSRMMKTSQGRSAPARSEISAEEWNGGRVYCAVLPKWHTLYVRRNGKAVWCGNTNAHASNWYQLTNKMVSCRNHDGNFFIIPANSLICFDEVYVTEIGNEGLADLVKLKEAQWKSVFPFFTVAERYADIAAKAARLDWRSWGLPTIWRITREVEEHILKCVMLVDNMRFYVDVERCPMFVSEAEAWQRDPNTGKQLDQNNHSMSNFRYAVANIDRKFTIQQMRGAGETPAAAKEEAKKPDFNLDLTQVPATGPASRGLDEMPDMLPMHMGASAHDVRI